MKTRVLRFLRSPKVGTALVLAVAAYSVLGTLVPQTSSSGRERVAAWTAAHPLAAKVLSPYGIFHVYSTPLFFLLLALLAVSTAACAWKRGSRALRLNRASGVANEAVLRRLKSKPEFVVPVVGRPAEPFDLLEAPMRKMGLLVRRGPRFLEASAGRAGLLGSPLFHWSIVALIVVIALGQLTRSEGLVAVPVGAARQDVAGSYLFLMQGPASMGQAGLTISVASIQSNVMIGGVDRGPSPQVRLSNGARRLRDQLVYPNHPLRYGSLMVHRNKLGLAVPVEVAAPDGSVLSTYTALFDLDEDTSTLASTTVELSGLSSNAETITLGVIPVRALSGAIDMRPQRVTSLTVEASFAETPAIVAAPGSYDIGGGYSLRFGSAMDYARLTVVRDWSVYPIYAILVVSMCALTLAMTRPYRVVWLLLVDGPDGLELHGVTMHTGRDPAFSGRIEAAVVEALTRAAGAGAAR